MKQTDTPDRFKNDKFKEHLRDNNDFMNTYRNHYNTSMALAWMNSVYSHDNIANDSSYQEPEYHSSFSSAAVIQAVPVVIQVVPVPATVSAADGDNADRPTIP